MDDYNRAIWVYLLKHKTEVYDKLVGFCSIINTQFDLNVRKFRSNIGGEFMNFRPISLKIKFYVDVP